MRPLSELPNTEGFRFVGVRHDGSRVECACTVSPGHVKFVGVPGAFIAPLKLAGWEPVEAAPSFRDEMGQTSS
jgi:hypothetical protein